MPSDEVECIFQDSKGYIWTGTRFGASVFDGHRFRNFQHDPLNPTTIGGSRVLEIKEDKRGDIWLVIENFGLTRIDRISFKIDNFKIPVSLEPEERYVNTIFIGGDSLFWVGTERGIRVFNPRTGVYNRLKKMDQDAELDVVSITKDRYGTFWGLTYEGELVYWNPADFKVKRMKGFGPSIGYGIHTLEDGSFIINTNKGLFELKPNLVPALSVLKRSSLYPYANDISAFSIDRSGNWWISNVTEGIQILFPGKGYLQKMNINWLTPIDLGISLWRSIIIDSDGGIWLGGEDGLFHFNPKHNHFRTYHAISKFNEQFSFGKTVGISNEGEDIIAVSLKGVAVFNRKAGDFVYLRFSKELHKKPIFFNGIAQKGKGLWWLSTSMGILEMRRVGDHFEMDRPSLFRNHPVLGKKEIYALSFSKDGDCWFATPTDGLYHYVEKTKSIANITAFGSGKFRRNILHLDFVSTDSSSGVLVGHHRGFALRMPGDSLFRQVQELTDTTFDFSSLSVYDIDYLFGKWWIATESHGLWRFDPASRKIKTYTQKDGLISNSVTAVHGLGKSRIAIGTDKGLSVFNVNSGKFVSYLKKDGLPSNQFQISADHEGEDDEVFMATTAGVISFRESELRQTVFTPKMNVYGISLNGRLLTDSQVHHFVTHPEMTIKYNSGLNISFSSLNFLSESDFDLRFKLSDNGEWKLSQSSEFLSLVNLDPGVYDISVQFVSRNTGVMSDRFSFQLTVVPPFWKTSWFVAIFLLLTLLMVYFGLRFYLGKSLRKHQKAMEKQKLIEQERVRIAMDLHDDIGGNLTALNLMTSLLGGMEMPDFSKQMVVKIGEASDRMVQDMNEIVWALNISNDTLISLVSYIRQYMSNTLTAAGMLFHMDEPETYPEIHMSGKTRRNIFMIVKEATNNAIKYSGSDHIDLKISVEGSLVITLKDYGKGIPEESTKATISGGGNGINNMRKRADDLGATISFTNEKGLTVTLSVPLQVFSETTDQLI